MKTIPEKTLKGHARRVKGTRKRVCREKAVRWICLSEQEAKNAARILLTPFVPNEAERKVAKRWADIPQLG